MSNLYSLYFSKLEEITQGKTKVKDFDYAVHVSLRNKFIYVENPKAACSTIKLTLQKLELERTNFVRGNFEDLHNRDFSPLLKLQNIPDFEQYFFREDFFRFCFVRDPFARLLSCYLDKIKEPLNNYFFKKKVLNSMGLLDKEGVGYPVSFEDFITVIEAQTLLEMDYHWRPQYYLTCQDKINYHFIGRLESFSKDFNVVGKYLSPDFNRYYSSEVRHKTNADNFVNAYYNSELLARVYSLYEIDFKKFSYDY